MKKITVPQGMRLAAGRASEDIDPQGFILYPALEAALQWLNEQLDKCIKPEPDQLYSVESIGDYDRRAGFNSGIRAAQELFVSPEEEEPSLMDLLYDANPFSNRGAKYRHDEAVKEAYRRGKEVKSSAIIDENRPNVNDVSPEYITNEIDKYIKRIFLMTAYNVLRMVK